MNNKELEQLFKLLADTDIYEFELEKQNSRIKIKRGEAQRDVITHHTALPARREEPQLIEVAALPKKVEAEDELKNVKYIVSPMVGTFYRSPSPESQPYTEAGDMVNKGQVLCIIEAMKLFNEIESDISGRVVKILVENGTPVEYGEKLYAIDVSVVSVSK